MARVSVVTGAASGIGAATAALLRSRGEEVIGVDLHDADVVADLSTTDGLAAMVADVTKASGGSVDAVYAIAGLSLEKALTVKVNYFGMVGTLVGLRPLLLGSSSPRAQGVTSMASLNPTDDQLVAALTADDRDAAVARCAALDESKGFIYSSSKKAFAQWIRRAAPTSEWAGASIPLNAVAPGVIRTAMTTDLLATEKGTDILLSMAPAPLNGVADATVVAELLSWLGSPANTHLCGQVIFVDGGSDAVLRGDSTW